MTVKKHRTVSKQKRRAHMRCQYCAHYYSLAELNLDAIKERMKKAELNPWVKRKVGIFGWSVYDPKAAWGTNDVVIAAGLDGDTAEFLRFVPADIRALIAEVEHLREKLKFRSVRKEK